MNISMYIEGLEAIKKEYGDLELVQMIYDDHSTDVFIELDKFPSSVLSLKEYENMSCLVESSEGWNLPIKTLSKNYLVVQAEVK